MDRQAHELTILSLLAVLGMIVASMRDDLTFVAVFWPRQVSLLPA